MDKGKNILEWCLLIAKIIFTIVLIVLGIKLIMFMFFPYLPIHIFVSSFEPFDWNPIATIGGAILTGLITWFAVYKTSELDKKSRLYELRYSHYISILAKLDEFLATMYKLPYYFEISEVNKIITLDYLKKDFEIRSFEKIFNYLCKINKKFKHETKGFNKQFALLKSAYSFFQKQVEEYQYYLQSKDKKFNKDFIIKFRNGEYVTYNIEKFICLFEKEKKINYDSKKINDAFKMLKDFVENEFKMD